MPDRQSQTLLHRVDVNCLPSHVSKIDPQSYTDTYPDTTATRSLRVADVVESAPGLAETLWPRPNRPDLTRPDEARPENLHRAYALTLVDIMPLPPHGRFVDRLSPRLLAGIEM